MPSPRATGRGITSLPLDHVFWKRDVNINHITQGPWAFPVLQFVKVNPSFVPEDQMFPSFGSGSDSLLNCSKMIQEVLQFREHFGVHADASTEQLCKQYSMLCLRPVYMKSFSQNRSTGFARPAHLRTHARLGKVEQKKNLDAIKDLVPRCMSAAHFMHTALVQQEKSKEHLIVVKNVSVLDIIQSSQGAVQFVHETDAIATLKEIAVLLKFAHSKVRVEMLFHAGTAQKDGDESENDENKHAHENKHTHRKVSRQEAASWVQHIMHGLVHAGVAMSVLQGRVMEHDVTSFKPVYLFVNLNPSQEKDALDEAAEKLVPRAPVHVSKVLRRQVHRRRSVSGHTHA